MGSRRGVPCRRRDEGTASGYRYAASRTIEARAGRIPAAESRPERGEKVARSDDQMFRALPLWAP